MASLFRIKYHGLVQHAVWLGLGFMVAGAVSSAANSTDDVTDSNSNNHTLMHVPMEGDEDETASGRGIQDVDYTSTQLKMMAYLPKAFALLSLLCSYAMAREVVVDHQIRLGGPISRMIFSRSIFDAFFSLGYFIGNWAVPQDSYYDAPGQYGTQATCNLQGFMLQLGFVGSVLANTILSVYYLWVVRFGWSDRDIAKLEPWMQGSIVVVALVSAIYPLPLELYNPALEGCYLGSDPPFCTGDEACIRGSDPTIHYYVYGFLPMICLVISTCIMIRLYRKVRQMENITRKYATSSVVPQAPPSRCGSMVASDDGKSSMAESDDGNNHDDANHAVMGSSDDGMALQSDDDMPLPTPLGSQEMGSTTEEQPTSNSSTLHSSSIKSPSPTTKTTTTTTNHNKKGKKDHVHSKDCLGVAARRSAPKPRVSRRKSIAVAKQGVFYVIAFLLTHFFSLLALILYSGWGIRNIWYNILVFSILTPSAGTFDFVVFARTREMKTPEGKVLRTMFFCGKQVSSMGKSTKHRRGSGSAALHQRTRYSGNNARLSSGSGSRKHQQQQQPNENDNGNDNNPQQQLDTATPATTTTAPPSRGVTFQDEQETDDVESGEASFIT